MIPVIQRFAGLVRDVFRSVTSPVPPRRAVARPGLTPGPSPEDLARWARSVVEKVRTAAAAGHLRFLPHLDYWTGETPEIRDVYREMVRESTIKAAIHSKVLDVAAQDMIVHPADPDDPRHREAGDFLAYSVARIKGPFLSGAPHLAWSILYHGLIDGWVAAEKVWDPELVRTGRFRGKRTWKGLKAKDSRSLTLVSDPYSSVNGIRAGRYNSGRIYDPRDFVLWSNAPFFETPTGTSDFRAAYRAYWSKHLALQLRNLHLDRYTGPFLKGTYAAESQKDALEAAMANARAEGWISIPPGAMVEAVDLAMSGTRDFESAIRDYDKEMLTAISFAYLQQMEGDTPDGRGDTKVHQKNADLPKWALSTVLGNLVSTQMAPDLYEVNYADVEPATVTWGAIGEQEMLLRLQVDKAFQEVGGRLSKKEEYRYLGRSEPAPDDELSPPQQGGQEQPKPGANGTGQAVPALPFGEDDCVGRKIKKLMDEGYEQPQAAAIAYKYCRESGHKDHAEAGKPSVPFAWDQPPGW